MDILRQSSLIVALICFSLGFSVLSRNVRNILFLSFSLLTTLISGWALTFFLEKTWSGYGFYRLHLFFNILITPAGLTFIRVFVRMRDTVSQRLLNFSILLSICLSAGLLLHLDQLAWVRQLIYFCPALIFLQVLQLMWIDHSIKNGMQKLPKMPTVGLGRQSLIYFGGMLVLATCVMVHTPWMGQIIPALGNMGLTIYVFFLSQAITQQRLLNFNALFSHFLFVLSVAFTLTGVYSLLVVWTENRPGLFFLNSFIASFLILMLLDPLRSLVSIFTQRLLTQKHRRLEQSLREAQRKLTRIVDPGTLFQAILQTTEHVLEPEWAGLFVLRSHGTKYRRVRTLGKEVQSDAHAHPHSMCREVLSQHPLIRHCETLARQGKFPVLLAPMLENEIDRSASRMQREHFRQLIQGLKALDTNLLIPLFASGKVLGFVALRAPSPPEAWGNNWGLLPILYPYFEQAAQTLQSMEIYAKQREKERLAALGEMAAGLAHEIRNPLGAIKGAAQFLDPSADRPESRFLTVIIEEVDRLNRVVTQFLDYSKPPATDLKRIDLSQLVAKMIDYFRPILRMEIELEFHTPRAPTFIMASSEQISQVLINLIQNSARALEGKPSGMIRLSIEVSPENKNEEVILSVEDTGHGIKKENMEKIFIPFFTTSSQGTGLGLSISHKIIEAHRGRLEVASEEGRFTRFSVILPTSTSLFPISNFQNIK